MFTCLAPNNTLPTNSSNHDSSSQSGDHLIAEKPAQQADNRDQLIAMHWGPKGQSYKPLEWESSTAQKAFERGGSKLGLPMALESGEFPGLEKLVPQKYVSASPFSDHGEIISALRANTNPPN